MNGFYLSWLIFFFFLSYSSQELDFPAGSAVKNLPANAGDMGSTLGREDPLEEEMATRSSILAWEIPRMERQEGYSPWCCRVELD